MAKALRGSPLRAFVRVQSAFRKFRDRIERRLRRFTIWRMSGTRDHRHLDRTIAFFLRNLDLADCPILVVGALQDRHRHPYVGEIFRNIPAAKFRCEPAAVQAVERVADIAATWPAGGYTRPPAAVAA